MDANAPRSERAERPRQSRIWTKLIAADPKRNEVSEFREIRSVGTVNVVQSVNAVRALLQQLPSGAEFANPSQSDRTDRHATAINAIIRHHPAF